MNVCVQGERVMNAIDEIEPLFRSVQDACIFALNFNLEQFARPTINAMSSPATGQGRGLGGMDGAAQAGMIREIIKRLGDLDERIVIARVAPKWKRCECGSACCSGRQPNKEWIEAIDWITRESVRRGMLAGCISHYRMRRGLIEKYFGVGGINLGKLAENCGMHRNTAGEQNTRMRKHLEDAERRAFEKLHALMVGAALVE